MRNLVAVTTLAALASVVRVPATRALARREPGGDAAVAIRTFQFAPDTVRVRAGTRVLWRNDDEIEHTITSGTPDTEDGRFHGVVAKRGATFSAELEKPGTYRYFCDRHRFMNGTVIVSR